MKNKLKKLITIFTSIMIIIIFSYFYNGLNSRNIISKVYGSSLASSNIVDLVTTPIIDSKVSADIEFLMTLIDIKNIKLDTSFFTSKSFTSLKDNSIKIGQVISGRKNPFNPIGNDNVISYPDIITNQPTFITDKTVVFNGTVNVTTEIINTYFEYGITDGLGTITSNIEPSSLGEFVKNITGLTAKTKYFYKACAQINSMPVCGEVISFNTN